MSPLLDSPATRREAIASLLAMLALVLGAGDSDAAGVSAEPVEQPEPSSHAVWHTDIHLFAHTDELPIPRNLDIGGDLVFDGATLRLDLWQEPDPIWIGHVEQPNIPLGSFVFIDEPAPLLNRLSVDADAEWLERKLKWAEAPFTFCPVCGCRIKDKPGCTNCGGTGWIHFTPEEGRQWVEQAHAERMALIAAAEDAARH